MNDEELRTREFNNLFDEYLRTAKMTADNYESLTPLQKTVVQCVKRAFNRMDND